MAIINNTAINIRVCVAFQINVFIFLGYVSRSGISISYGSSVFNFLKNLHTFSIVAVPIYIPADVIPFFPHPCQHLLFDVFVMRAILTDVR